MAISKQALDAAKDLFQQLDEHWRGHERHQGMDRAGWSWEETNAMQMMSAFAKDELGMNTYEDLAGNRYLITQGTHNPSSAVRMSGSHLDAVKNGGRYDGPAGIIAPLIAMYQNKLNGDKCNQPVVIPIWRNEESPWIGQFGVGSKFAMGALSAEFLKSAKHTSFNLPLLELMDERLDLRGTELLKKIQSKDARLIDPKTIDRALETHIEQGLELEKAKKSLGFVTSIRGNVRFPDMIDFFGEEGHSGALPQQERKSAMIAMAKYIFQCDKIFTEHQTNGFDIVWDFPQGGDVNGKPTTVSGQTSLRPEVRSTDAVLLQHASANFEYVAQCVEEETGVKININTVNFQQPVAMSSTVNLDLLKDARRLGISAMEVPSGAGHDIQILAQGTKEHDGVENTGLIFIRHNGLSHRPDELLGRNKNDNPFCAGSDFTMAIDVNRLFLLGTAQPKERLKTTFRKDIQNRGARTLNI